MEQFAQRRRKLGLRRIAVRREGYVLPATDSQHVQSPKDRLTHFRKLAGWFEKLDWRTPLKLIAEDLMAMPQLFQLFETSAPASGNASPILWLLHMLGIVRWQDINLPRHVQAESFCNPNFAGAAQTVQTRSSH